MSDTQLELPKYNCTKQVQALKIASITDADGDGATIHPADKGYKPFRVGQEYMAKHEPQDGGYYVVYTDGYKSYSPAKAFEEGYTKTP